MRLSPLLLLPFALWLGCSDDSGDSSGKGGSTQRGTTAKGEPCTVNTDCAADNARCLKEGTVSACTGALGDGAFEQECEGATPDAAATCPGLFCISLKPNQQNKKGICTVNCTTSADCGGSALCLPLSTQGSFCLNSCQSDADCSNGFVCVPDKAGSVCLVRVQ